jgi:hypothetical protein
MQAVVVIVAVAVVAGLIWKSRRSGTAGQAAVGQLAGGRLTYAGYQQKYPDNRRKHRLTCFRCGNTAIGSRPDNTARVHACNMCGEVLFQS